MAEYDVVGGNKLYGEYRLQKAKNSVLALMCASVLTRGETLIKNCPDISDVFILSKILKKLGARVRREGVDLYIDTKDVYSTKLPEKPCDELRASLFLVGPLLARFKTVSFAGTGGCRIGSRPIDIHVEALEKLGASCGDSDGRLLFYAGRSCGGKVRLRYPSVGATENVMMFAALTRGETVIENCAKEPEIKDLQDYLNACGGRVTGAGTGRIIVYGVEKLHGGVAFEPISDRIECGSILLTVLSCGGEVTISGANPENICVLTEKICNNTCKLTIYNDKIYIQVKGRPYAFGRVVTAPYPQFATDLHPQLAACAAVADGKTAITETVFDDRFCYVGQLKRFGADMTVEGSTVRITGKHLHGATVEATDLRGGMALVTAALAAEGRSKIREIHHIERGYERLPEKLRALGADITVCR